MVDLVLSYWQVLAPIVFETVLKSFKKILYQGFIDGLWSYPHTFISLNQIHYIQLTWLKIVIPQSTIIGFELSTCIYFKDVLKYMYNVSAWKAHNDLNICERRLQVLQIRLSMKYGKIKWMHEIPKLQCKASYSESLLFNFTASSVPFCLS